MHDRTTTSASVAEARTSLGEILDRAQSGQRIIITRYGKPTAVIVGVESNEILRQVEARMSSILTQIAGETLLEEQKGSSG